MAEAIAAIPNKNDIVDDAFVEGYVCTAAESVNAGMMTYYISADGVETSRLQIYNGRNINNMDFAATTDLAIGDKVIIFGQLKNFNGTKEMNTGNYIVAYTAKGVVADVAISGDATKKQYVSGTNFETTGLLATATFANGYAADVTNEATWSATPEVVTMAGTIVVTATYMGVESGPVNVEVTLTSPTAIDNATDNEKLIKYIENGQLFIKKQGIIYNVLGEPIR